MLGATFLALLLAGAQGPASVDAKGAQILLWLARLLGACGCGLDSVGHEEVSTCTKSHL